MLPADGRSEELLVMLVQLCKIVDSVYYTVAIKTSKLYSVCEQQLSSTASQVKPESIDYSYGVIID